jgi:hypothetical protein
MLRSAFLVVTLCFGLPAMAAEVKLNGAAIKDLLSDITLTSTETGREVEQVFQKSGVTFTVDVEAKLQSTGFWKLEGDKYCSQWPPSEHWSCYDVYGGDQGVVVFVSSLGKRYTMELLPSD